MEACAEGNAEIAELLIDAGASMVLRNAVSNGC